MNISFIIPTYNASETISRCLDSIYALSINEDEFEVIVVDDCSTDDTTIIIKEYVKRYRNLFLLHQEENCRQGAARNKGLKFARGKYITFVDSDDFILDGIIHALSKAEEINIDLMYCTCYHEKTSTDVFIKEIDMSEDIVMNGVDFCEQYQHEGVFWYPWGILYRREWLVNLKYPFVEYRQHEDRDWLAYIMSCADSIMNSKVPMYQYVFNQNSTCRRPRYSTIFDHIASGIRHLDLSEQLKYKCPKLAKSLQIFGIDEIHKSIRVRNLTKYTWNDNKYLLTNRYLTPLLPDLQRICRIHRVPIQVSFVAYFPHLIQIITFFAGPIATFIRNLKH